MVSLDHHALERQAISGTQAVHHDVVDDVLGDSLRCLDRRRSSSQCHATHWSSPTRLPAPVRCSGFVLAHLPLSILMRILYRTTARG